jgi:hypothetical protein
LRIRAGKTNSDSGAEIAAIAVIDEQDYPAASKHAGLDLLDLIVIQLRYRRHGDAHYR